MKNYTIYAFTEQDDRDIIRTINRTINEFPVSEAADILKFSCPPTYSKTIISNTTNGKGNINISVIKPLTDQELFYNNLNQVTEYLISLEQWDEILTHDLLLQLTMTNIIINITADAAVSYSIYELCGKLNNLFEGIAALENIILLDKNNHILLLQGVPSDLSEIPPITVRPPQRNDESSKESYNRKIKSIKKLVEKNIPIYIQLPELLSSDQVSLRSKEDIAKRTVALLLLIQFAHDVMHGEDLPSSRKLLPKLLNRYGVTDKLTDNELLFIYDDKPNETAAINYTWQSEACQVLLWALGLIDKLPYPSKLCDSEKAASHVRECRNFQKFYKKTRLKGIHELLDEADLTYRYGWACINARHSRSNIPAELNPNIITERHRAFHWLLHYDMESWDHFDMKHFEKAMSYQTQTIIG